MESLASLLQIHRFNTMSETNPESPREVLSKEDIKNVVVAAEDCLRSALPAYKQHRRHYKSQERYELIDLLEGIRVHVENLQYALRYDNTKQWDEK